MGRLSCDGRPRETSEFRKADKEPGWHTIMEAKARGFSEAGAESHEMLRMIIKKRPVNIHALLSAYL